MTLPDTWRFCCFALMAGLGLLTALPAQAEKRVALVIGNGAYANATPLSNPRNGVVTLSEIGPIWTINQQAKSLNSLASTLAIVGKFRSV